MQTPFRLPLLTALILPTRCYEVLPIAVMVAKSSALIA